MKLPQKSPHTSLSQRILIKVEMQGTQNKKLGQHCTTRLYKVRRCIHLRDRNQISKAIQHIILFNTIKKEAFRSTFPKYAEWRINQIV